MAPKHRETGSEDTTPRRSRRAAMQAIGLGPLMVIGCGTDDAPPKDAPGGDAGRPPAPQKEAGPPPPPPHPNVALLQRFVEAFNAHDLDRTLAFFSDGATVRLNGRTFEGQPEIRAFLTEYGSTAEGAALGSASMAFDDAIAFDGGVAMISGALVGAPKGAINGFEAATSFVQMAFGGVFQLDGADRFGSCDVIVNWGALMTTPI